MMDDIEWNAWLTTYLFLMTHNDLIAEYIYIYIIAWVNSSVYIVFPSLWTLNLKWPVISLHRHYIIRKLVTGIYVLQKTTT